MLPTGKVLLFGYPGVKGTNARLWDPTTGIVDNLSLSRRRDLFCGGHTLLADGRLFVVGGTKYNAAGNVGVEETDTFDPFTLEWSKGPAMSTPRWYPTTLELPDGRVLIVSGQKNNRHPVSSVEIYDPDTEALTRWPDARKRLDLYPSMHVLPNELVLTTGPAQTSRYLDPATGDWQRGPAMKYGSRYGGASVLLPGLDSVLAVGGTRNVRATATAEILDLSAAAPRWRYTAPMNRARQHLNAVLLADGTVLAVGGGRKHSYDEPVKTAELFDSGTETWTTMAAQQAPRSYHSTAVLLPDGRVLSAGQDHGSRQRTAEVFSPPYLFAGPRPVITTSPSAVAYGETFSVATSDAADIARVAFVKPGSVTHSVNFDQRYVDVIFEPGPNDLSVVGPASANVAPPGWYMLFIVSTDGAPSVATWVHIS